MWVLELKEWEKYSFQKNLVSILYIHTSILVRTFVFCLFSLNIRMYVCQIDLVNKLDKMYYVYPV